MAMISTERRYWTVVLVGGPSGTGKTMVAERVGLQFHVPWLQVDDLRLALQRSQVTLPRGTDALYFFLDHPDVSSLPPERLRDGLIAVGEVLFPALEVVIEHHVVTDKPLVIEGDGILPSLVARSAVREYVAGGHVRAVFLIEPDESAIRSNMLARGRGFEARTTDEQHIEVQARQLYGQWLAEEAQRYGLPVLESRPWDTLVERVLAATTLPAEQRQQEPR
jgi:2-phosphoglycerate kinase